MFLEDVHVHCAGECVCPEVLPVRTRSPVDRCGNTPAYDFSISSGLRHPDSESHWLGPARSWTRGSPRNSPAAHRLPAAAAATALLPCAALPHPAAAFGTLSGTVAVSSSATAGASVVGSAVASDGFLPSAADVQVGQPANGTLLVAVPGWGTGGALSLLNVSSTFSVPSNAGVGGDGRARAVASPAFTYSLVAAMPADGFAVHLSGTVNADGTLSAVGTVHDSAGGKGNGTAVLYAAWDAETDAVVLDLTFAYPKGVVEKESFVMAAISAPHYAGLAATFSAAATGAARTQ